MPQHFLYTNCRRCVYTGSEATSQAHNHRHHDHHRRRSVITIAINHRQHDCYKIVRILQNIFFIGPFSLQVFLTNKDTAFSTLVLLLYLHTFVHSLSPRSLGSFF